MSTIPVVSIALMGILLMVLGANVTRGQSRSAQHVAVLGPQRPRHGLRGRRDVLHIDDGHLTAPRQRKAPCRIEQPSA